MRIKLFIFLRCYPPHWVLFISNQVMILFQTFNFREVLNSIQILIPPCVSTFLKQHQFLFQASLLVRVDCLSENFSLQQGFFITERQVFNLEHIPFQHFSYINNLNILNVSFYILVSLNQCNGFTQKFILVQEHILFQPL